MEKRKPPKLCNNCNHWIQTSNGTCYHRGRMKLCFFKECSCTKPEYKEVEDGTE